MKAAQISTYGDASVIHIKNIDRPTISEGKVLVEVYASSINPFDITIRSGYMQKMVPLTLPVTLGGDFAGIVTELGAGVTHIAIGDKVYGQANAIAGNSGAFAEYTLTNAGQVAKAPERCELIEAAALPLVGVSALQALTTHINIRPGQHILITGGTGGIGSLAVQIAKHLGAHVTATATGDGVGLAKKLGADEVIDYKTQDLASLPKTFDAVFDTVGNELFDKTLRVLKAGGIAVSMIGQPNEALAKELGVTAMMQRTQVTTEALNALRELVDSNVVVPQVDKIFPLDAIADAFKAKENGDIKGKIVIKIR